MTDKYILRDKTPILEPDLLACGRWFGENRAVARTVIKDTTISTVFLGIDHSFSDDGPPILFETLVFGGPLNDEQARYATWDEAEKGHATIVERVKAAQ